MKTLFRLESFPQAGIYALCGLSGEKWKKIDEIRKLMEEHFGNNLAGPKHPTPLNDSLLFNNIKAKGYSTDSVFYGFSSMAQLRAWFYSDPLLEKMDELGCTLAAYNVSLLMKGNAQACAPKSDCKPENVKWRISIGEFLKFCMGTQ
jgi:hypothetical protein